MKRYALLLAALITLLIVETVGAVKPRPKVDDDADLVKLVLPFKGAKLAWLNDSKVTDAGLQKLTSLNELRRINLYNSKVTDAGMKYLATFEKLEDLYLGFTEVTDAGIKEVSVLKQLKTLDLTSTRATDGCLKDLASLRQLQTLFLNETRVTEAGLAELRRALPQCRILPFVFAKQNPT